MHHENNVCRVTVYMVMSDMSSFADRMKCATGKLSVCYVAACQKQLFPHRRDLWGGLFCVSLRSLVLTCK